ncbi:MAG: hypothetical protein PSY12_15675, partial [bacterium]|nr:hypothetical protein [bacterium]
MTIMVSVHYAVARLAAQGSGLSPESHDGGEQCLLHDRLNPPCHSLAMPVLPAAPLQIIVSA